MPRVPSELSPIGLHVMYGQRGLVARDEKIRFVRFHHCVGGGRTYVKVKTMFHADWDPKHLCRSREACKHWTPHLQLIFIRRGGARVRSPPPSLCMKSRHDSTQRLRGADCTSACLAQSWKRMLTEDARFEISSRAKPSMAVSAKRSEYDVNFKTMMVQAHCEKCTVQKE